MEGKKTLEIRKNTPHLDFPFKCYIYESAGRTFRFGVRADTIAKYREERYLDLRRFGPNVISVNGTPYFCYGRKKVVGEFTCDYILGQCQSANADIAEQQGFIKREKLIEYANGRALYGWHISDLVIYDEPKELSEFTKEGDCDAGPKCKKCPYFEKGNEAAGLEDDCVAPFDTTEHIPIIRPPQSWCYVEENNG